MNRGSNQRGSLFATPETSVNDDYMWQNEFIIYVLETRLVDCRCVAVALHCRPARVAVSKGGVQPRSPGPSRVWPEKALGTRLEAESDSGPCQNQKQSSRVAGQLFSRRPYLAYRNGLALSCSCGVSQFCYFSAAAQEVWLLKGLLPDLWLGAKIAAV